MNVTVLYYTANKEKPDFEARIIDALVGNCGDLPIVSVSQRPLNLGTNICVGEHYPCYFNEFRQIQLGLREVKSEFVLTAESDFIYPPEYFRFFPNGNEKCYRYKNVWVLHDWDTLFRFKGYSDGAQLVRREDWIDLITQNLTGRNMWVKKGEDSGFPRSQYGTRTSFSWSGRPAITFKTRANIRVRTQLSKRSMPQCVLDYWGAADKVKEDFCV